MFCSGSKELYMRFWYVCLVNFLCEFWFKLLEFGQNRKFSNRIFAEIVCSKSVEIVVNVV